MAFSIKNEGGDATDANLVFDDVLVFCHFLGDNFGVSIEGDAGNFGDG